MTRSLVRLWALLLIIKLILSAWIPLSPDEAYYWVWSRFLQLSYYDHPAMVAWLLKLGDPFLWLGSAVRWPAIFLGHLTLGVWLYILQDMLDESHRRTFLILASLAPLTGVGSLIVTPDLPLLFFWSCSLLCLQQALRTQKTSWYVLLGASLGLGFCSKYHIVLFVPILAVWLIAERVYKQVQWSKALLSVVVGLVFCFPVLYWNYQNDFASFRFQLDHGLGQKVWKPSWTLEYVLGQIGLIFPPLLYVLLKSAKRLRNSWLFYFGWGPVLFFLFTSFKGQVEANWPITAYPALLALVVLAQQQLGLGTKAIRATVVCWCAVYLVFLSNLVVWWLPGGKWMARIEVMIQYRALKKYAEKYHPIYAGNYQMASVLSFETRNVVYKAQGYSRHDFFDELPGAKPTEDVFYTLTEKEQRLPAELVAQGYKVTVREKIDSHHFFQEVRRE